MRIIFSFARVMNMKAYDVQAPKKPINLSINSGLQLNMLENELARQLKVKQREQWLEENTKAIQAYNDFVENEGVFSDGI